MSDKPEALRLADALERDKWHVPAVVMQAAADELRRLHDDNENTLKHFSTAVEAYRVMAAQRDALLEALKLARSIIGHPDDAHSQMIDAAIKTVEETK